MSKPETRTLWHPIQGADIKLSQPIEVVTQEAIPWCTTHDGTADACECWAMRTGTGDDETPCIISTGGPDHKWWKDIA